MLGTNIKTAKLAYSAERFWNDESNAVETCKENERTTEYEWPILLGKLTQSLAIQPVNFNGGLAYLGLTSFVKWATDARQY